MYCCNCKCDGCLSIRLGADEPSKAQQDALRLIIKSGVDGKTLAELVRFSRHFRALDREQQAALLDRLEMQGKVIKHTFPAPERGRFRVAYLAAEISQ